MHSKSASRGYFSRYKCCRLTSDDIILRQPVLIWFCSGSPLCILQPLFMFFQQPAAFPAMQRHHSLVQSFSLFYLLCSLSFFILFAIIRRRLPGLLLYELFVVSSVCIIFCYIAVLESCFFTYMFCSLFINVLYFDQFVYAFDAYVFLPCFCFACWHCSFLTIVTYRQ